ncbi:redoxin domain-containing protein [uncultured Sunxiuqinia sp.]|uniref:peroxiredoxin family protein n=1 Tax=uncultured Sunxiuqinia sp. TaxID=1573825 RepID=UPI002AA7804F|nr:redoxin domain-containing protein [uncultured Sunxiuqinia sp.]
MHFEELRGFTYSRNYASSKTPSNRELIRLASLSQHGKILYDYLEYMAPKIYYYSDQQEIDALHEIVKENFDNSSLQMRIKDLEVRNVKIKSEGQFPPITFKNMDGEQVQLSKFNGKVIYLMFWRNDALILNKEWEEFHKQAQEMKNQKVVFVNVGVEENFKNWQNYVKGMELNGLSLFVDRNSDEFKAYLKGLKTAITC